MPFRGIFRGYDTANVSLLFENQTGVYGLYRSGAWVYVGKGNMRKRLLDHLNGDNPCISGQGPTLFITEVVSGDPVGGQKYSPR